MQRKQCLYPFCTSVVQMQGRLGDCSSDLAQISCPAHAHHTVLPFVGGKTTSHDATSLTFNRDPVRDLATLLCCKICFILRTHIVMLSVQTNCSCSSTSSLLFVRFTSSSVPELTVEGVDGRSFKNEQNSHILFFTTPIQKN